MRGHLRIYLGAAPGVGKTFAMLGEGHRRAARGTDVVVAYVEDHARPRTREQLAGLEVVPRKVMVYRDQPFEEMDLDAVLARSPAVALVDELAHTNIPGSIHEKRWEDVEVLLDAGIDVITTVNVQHLESLNDVVERITGITQRETVPDHVVRQADQVELVDMTPEALRRRMVHGNIYGPDKVDDALGNYFRVGNLTALRELALMWLANQIDEELTDYQDLHGIDHTWEARERVVVAMTGAPSGEQVIRRAARIATRARGDLVGVHVRTGDGLRSPSPSGLERQKALLTDLGGAYHEVAGDDVPAALVRFAQADHATQIVLGATAQDRWRELWRGSVVNRVVRGSGELDVHVISRGPDDEDASARRWRPPQLWRSPLSARRRATGWAIGLGGLVVLTLLLVAIRDTLDLPGDLMVYVLLVVAAAAVGGTGPGLTTAVASGFAVNWFLTEPYHTLTIAEAENSLALVVFVLVSVVVSLLVSRAERRAADARRARQEAEALASAAAGLALRDDPVPSLLDRVRTTFGLEAATIFVRTGESWNVEYRSGESALDDPAAASVEVPVGDRAVLALIGEIHADDRLVLSAFAAQLDTALEQRQLRADAAAAAVVAEGDALRTALLQAVSHDLRTPLASIKASVSSLLQDDVTWSEADRREFNETIDEETDRLDHLVGNLLDMSRLQTGALHVNARPVGWEEVVAAAVASLTATDGAELVIDVPETLPPIRGDLALLERAVANVLANALRHGAGQPVQVLAEARPDSVDLLIIDHGPGVPADQRERLFEPFQQLGDSGGTGVGLGLAVAHGFVAALGGRIEPEHTPGGGLTMRIALPLADAPGSTP